MRIYSTILPLSSPLLQGASGQRAKVYIDGVLKAKTDANGKYELSDMSTGKCRVTVSMVMSVAIACTYIRVYVHLLQFYVLEECLVGYSAAGNMHCRYVRTCVCR